MYDPAVSDFGKTFIIFIWHKKDEISAGWSGSLVVTVTAVQRHTTLHEEQERINGIFYQSKNLLQERLHEWPRVNLVQDQVVDATKQQSNV